MLLATHSAPNDLFVSMEYRPLDFYLPYFNRRRVVLRQFVGAEGTAALEATLRRLTDETTASGGRVFVYECSTPPSAAVAALAGTGGLQPLGLEADPVPGFGACEIRSGSQAGP